MFVWLPALSVSRLIGIFIYTAAKWLRQGVSAYSQVEANDETTVLMPAEAASPKYGWLDDNKFLPLSRVGLYEMF